jgi:uncharacterized protein
VLDDHVMPDNISDTRTALSGLDGFLTGIFIGPASISPTEWLSTLWGGAEPEFEDEEEMQTVIDTILGWYDEIATCFHTDPNEFEPILWEGREGEVVAANWVAGFSEAIALRQAAWKPLKDDERARKFLVLLSLLGGDINAGDDRLLEDSADTLRACIIGIYEFWRSRSRSLLNQELRE